MIAIFYFPYFFVINNKFSELGEVIRQKMVRLADGRYSCSECPYIANYSSNLFSHIEANHKVKGLDPSEHKVDYTCQICSKPHATKNALRKHLKRQHFVTNSMLANQTGF